MTYANYYISTSVHRDAGVAAWTYFILEVKLSLLRIGVDVLPYGPKAKWKKSKDSGSQEFYKDGKAFDYSMHLYENYNESLKANECCAVYYNDEELFVFTAYEDFSIKRKFINPNSFAKSKERNFDPVIKIIGLQAVIHFDGLFGCDSDLSKLVEQMQGLTHPDELEESQLILEDLIHKVKVVPNDLITEVFTRR